MSTEKSRPRYANGLSTAMAAAINGLYRFTREQSAQDKLARITAGLTLAKAAPDAVPDGTVTLWIRDFELTPEMEEAGYLGNYAKLSVARMDDEDGHYTITTELVERELRQHPLRKRVASRAPNWGHPILRSVLAETTYASLEEADAQLNALHLEYPETTIPSQNKLYLMIFSRRETPEKPLQKYVLEITNLQGGGFVITSKKNEYKKTAKIKTAAPGTEEETAAPKPTGHFTSMVALKSRKRKTSN